MASLLVLGQFYLMREVGEPVSQCLKTSRDEPIFVCTCLPYGQLSFKYRVGHRPCPSTLIEATSLYLGGMVKEQ